MTRKEIKGRAKTAFKQNFGVFIGALLAMVLLSIMLSALYTEMLFRGSSYLLLFIVIVIAYFFMIMMSIGYVYMAKKGLNNDNIQFTDLFRFSGNLGFKGVAILLLQTVIVSIGYICLVIPGIILTYGLSQSLSVFVDNPDTGVIEALKTSWRITKGYKFDIFVFQLSFILWYILCAVTFGIAAFYVSPYVSIANYNYYEFLKNRDNSTDYILV